MTKWTVEADADTISNIETNYPVLFWPERICLPVYAGSYDSNPKCSACGEHLADGVLKLPKYCGECGARVIEK